MVRAQVVECRPWSEPSCCCGCGFVVSQAWWHVKEKMQRGAKAAAAGQSPSTYFRRTRPIWMVLIAAGMGFYAVSKSDRGARDGLVLVGLTRLRFPKLRPGWASPCPSWDQ